MHLWVIVLLGLVLAGCASLRPADQAASATGTGTPLSVMTFNLRYASPKPPHSWPERRPIMRECIRSIAPDVFGTQEGLYTQLKDMAADLPEYDWIGLGREGGTRGEFMAIFYRRNRLEPLEYDHYWLSDTPEVIASSTWGNTCKRMVTWVRFRDRRSKQEFYFVNTHLDHEVQAAREKGAALIAQRSARFDPKLPIILVGDFNAGRSNKAYTILTSDSGFTDTWYAAAQRGNEDLNTFHGYKPALHEGERIDWILARGAVAADSTEIVTFSQNGQTPSDHFPVLAKLRIGAPVPTTAPAPVR